MADPVYCPECGGEGTLTRVSGFAVGGGTGRGDAAEQWEPAECSACRGSGRAEYVDAEALLVLEATIADWIGEIGHPFSGDTKRLRTVLHTLRAARGAR